MYGYVDLVQSVLASPGANVDVRNKNLETPLLLAFRSGQFTVAKVLLEHDADIGLVSTFGDTPFHWVAAFGDHAEKVLDLLIQARGLRDGCLTDQIKSPLYGHQSYLFHDYDVESGMDPISCAILANHLQSVQALICLFDRLSLKKVPFQNSIWLRLAARLRHLEILQALLDISSLDAINSKHGGNNTPLYWAMISESRFDQLIRHSSSADSNATVAIQMLLASGASGECCVDGRTSWEVAVESGPHYLETSLLLVLSFCCDGGEGFIPSEDSRRKALASAIERGERQAFDFLMDITRRPDLQVSTPLKDGDDAFLTSLLHYCVFSPEEDSVYFARALVEEGRLDPRTRDQYGLTAFAHAALRRREALMDYLWLLDPHSLNRISRFGLTVLGYAIHSSTPDLLKWIMRKNRDGRHGQLEDFVVWSDARITTSWNRSTPITVPDKQPWTPQRRWKQQYTSSGHPFELGAFSLAIIITATAEYQSLVLEVQNRTRFDSLVVTKSKAVLDTLFGYFNDDIYFNHQSAWLDNILAWPIFGTPQNNNHIASRLKFIIDQFRGEDFFGHYANRYSAERNLGSYTFRVGAHPLNLAALLGVEHAIQHLTESRYTPSPPYEGWHIWIALFMLVKCNSEPERQRYERCLKRLLSWEQNRWLALANLRKDSIYGKAWSIYYRSYESPRRKLVWLWCETVVDLSSSIQGYHKTLFQAHAKNFINPSWTGCIDMLPRFQRPICFLYTHTLYMYIPYFIIISGPTAACAVHAWEGRDSQPSSAFTKFTIVFILVTVSLAVCYVPYDHSIVTKC